MGNNRRKVYMEACEAEGGEACRECGCRHSYVVRKGRAGAEVRTVRRCRNCGREFHASEPA